MGVLASPVVKRRTPTSIAVPQLARLSADFPAVDDLTTHNVSATPTPGFQTLRCFGGFTHHPNYAGDLIFGARTQVTSLWHALHADAHARTPCIDKIELASITLDNEAEIPHGTASATAAGETGVQKGDTEASLNVSSSLDLLAIASHNMEDIVDLSHPSPPTTPLTTSRSMHPHSHIHSSHGRSMSVPPSELWSTMARPTHVHGIHNRF
ncbi:hypothetical protein BU15DRAFT_77340 [Melanogaster broomeanus]|nr:hypothetical protein BU15DRAFT_77340 [Melanogaster broomeanus]